jgi:hypothetical protein
MFKIKKRIFLILFLIAISLAILFCFSVLREDVFLEHEGASRVTKTDLKAGKKLAKDYCASCHLYPEPNLLPQRIWQKNVLPNMGPRLGIFNHKGTKYPVDKDPHLPKNYYPSHQQLSSNEWQKILTFYTNTAPESLSMPKRSTEIIKDPHFFKARAPEYKIDPPPTASAIQFDPGNQLIYTTDIDGKYLLIFNRFLELENTLNLDTPIADIEITNDFNKQGTRNLLITYIGDFLPSNAPKGFVAKVGYDPSGGGSPPEVLIDSLVRPVESQLADLDRDGRKDLLISEFGHQVGGLFWLKNNREGYDSNKRMLIETPGCIQSHITDYTNNSLPDIIALCTQIDQTIYLFQNQGEGKFTKKILHRFNITAGSSSFELHDFNRDGHPDILYTSGDNNDLSKIYKPYHGIYIFLNDGNDNFSKEWFYHINGAYDAKASDFNQDGHPDIATISFFGNYKNRPEESFVFFQNNGDLTFTPYHPPSTTGGRWITMDVADWTGDGYDDIILANFSLGPPILEGDNRSINDNFKSGPLFLLLENHYESP